MEIVGRVQGQKARGMEIRAKGSVKLPLLIYLRLTQQCPGEGKSDLTPCCLL